MTTRRPSHHERPTKPLVRDSGQVEGAAKPLGNREVPPAPSVPALEEQLTQLEAERDEHLNDLKRVAADFENYRKRVARDQESLVARAHERLVKELLPVLDDLERALAAAEEHEEAKLEEVKAALTREGLAEIETYGRFDPHVHEALHSQAYEAEEVSVLEDVLTGF